MNNKVDVVICITSFNRYDNVKSLINQFITQKSEYTYQILLINDGSNDSRYTTFEGYSDNLTYINKSENGGKNGYYKTINMLWSLIPSYDCDYVIQMDDDFILCNNFLDTLINDFKISRENNSKLLAICPHLYSFNKISNYEKTWFDTSSVDGIAIMVVDVLKNMDFALTSPGDVNKFGASVGIWQQISKSIKELYGISKRTNHSLVYHDNTSGSMLHKEFRNSKMIFTQKFMDPLPKNVTEFDENFLLTFKKKSSRGIPNGKKIEKNEPYTPPIQTEAIINSPIDFDKTKLNSIKQGLQTQKQSRINKIGDDVFLAKSRKRNLRFGGK